MMTVRCKTCAKDQGWRTKYGGKLKDLHCQHCGAVGLRKLKPEESEQRKQARYMALLFEVGTCFPPKRPVLLEVARVTTGVDANHISIDGTASGEPIPMPAPVAALLALCDSGIAHNAQVKYEAAREEREEFAVAVRKVQDYYNPPAQEPVIEELTALAAGKPARPEIPTEAQQMILPEKSAGGATC